MARTIVALYDSIDDAHKAVEDLLAAGFDRDHISLVARDVDERYASEIDASDDDDMGKAVASGAATGGALGAIAGVLVGINSLAIPGVGPIVAVGPIAGGLMGLGLGAAAGGLAGGLVEAGVSEDEADTYAEGVRRGGSLVTVHADDALADDAANILNRHHAVDINERATRWRDEGWERHDHTADPYTAEQIERERSLYTQPRR